VYVDELGQYPPNDHATLPEASSEQSTAIVAETSAGTAGFVRVTPPTATSYAADRHVPRDAWGITDFGDVAEIRTLTLHRDLRSSVAAAALMYAALRWARWHGAGRVIAMARAETCGLYLRVGFRRLDQRLTVGRVAYDLVTADLVDVLACVSTRYRQIVREIERRVEWRLTVPLRDIAEHCEHGGRSIDVVGPRLDLLGERQGKVAADVLDAWFPPSPRVIAALSEDVAWLCRTAPPAAAAGLADEIARARDVPRDSLVIGAGSSDLMYRSFLRWFSPATHGLLVRPTYGEYRHLLTEVLNARVDSLELDAESGWRLDLDGLARRLAAGPDLFVLVNPANPTGQHIDRDDLLAVLREAPGRTLIWVDEAYIDYVDPTRSLERYAARSKNVVVCKSMSKAYALSGMRVAYLVTPPPLAADLRAVTPPWPVNLAGQRAGIEALQDPGYYAQRWRETHRLRRRLATDLRTRCRVQVSEGTANSVLVRLPVDASVIVERCRAQGVYLRDVTSLAPNFEGRHVRIAVRTEEENDAIADALDTALRTLRPRTDA
jgi:histidinol-phosphate/aromatic aminotransferase/cobyric acid decarboxylase-like protein